MANSGALPLAFRMSSRTTTMPKQLNAQKPLPLYATCHLVVGSSRVPSRQFRYLGPRIHTKSCSMVFSIFGARNLCTSSSRADESSGNPLPWLVASVVREPRKAVKNERSRGVRSSWEESAERFLKDGSSTVEIGEAHKSARRRNEYGNKGYTYVEDEQGDEGAQFVSDLRQYNIRNRIDRIAETRVGSGRPEVRRWDKQEAWGRSAWKEARESTVPKIVGEGIYGVGPVLAALSAVRREFYTLYVVEGVDLSSNNKKKKDKKAFEKVLKIADKIGLNIKEVSKHDLNMVVDNRPHQGLVLDASPLEMVGIKELEPVSTEDETGPLWLALDEVSDPQNLGAIIRSAYYFGASGVVLCAKNSAPLSGVVSKASAGSLELMELRSCKNMMQFLSSSAGNGWRILGASVSPRAVPLNVIPPGAPTVLVLGSEGTGLRPLVERSCTHLIRIPGNQPINLVSTGDEDIENVEGADQEFRSFLAVESLNVSVAAGVLLNHLIGIK